MPATDFQGSSSPSLFGRSIMNLRRDQVHSMDNHHEPESSQEHALEAFQRLVADLFQDLAGGEELLSLPWVCKLLEAFLLCQEEFRVVFFSNRAIVGRAPVDRLATDFFDRSVKALDVCNAIRDGIEQVRQWHKHLDIVTLAFDPTQKTIGEGQVRRAKKALVDLAIGMLDEKDTASSLAQRNRSFSRSHGANKDHRRAECHFRSLSWCVSRSWSASRQLQAIGNNLSAPRGHDVVATNGLAVPVYTMNSVLLFVMWALVAAIPCQDRGLQTHFSIPRTFPWAAPILLLHERILEESKKRERRNSYGLLTEIHQMEKHVRRLSELTENIQFPLAEEKETDVRNAVRELSLVREAMKGQLDLLEDQVRQVFHRIVRGRTDGLDCLSHYPV
ncbi:uncharacterized protein LOC120261880 [Dioscorea cayenensis subsp. rotundata]|uniref:Uncharacterized protein LOC120261880 n=1 Tax=Dioscorea cayennensis subsp. rotundata TaxID=55577 RepID=A0AB40BER3_DIOCR|nr:uncharacterized protein LOC120261880 [Dioscorea cayenensis subsp. rotundata]